MSSQIKIGLIEDQHLFREGMKAILSLESDFDVVFESADGYTVLDKLSELKLVPDVMMVDLSLPPNNGNEFDGVRVTDTLMQHYPEMKVIILSVHDEEGFIAELIEHGANGYLVKDSDPNEVVEAIRSTYTKGSYINHKALVAIQNKMKGGAGPAFHQAPSFPLTKREIEILQLVCEQLTAEEIGERLFISMKTVNGHKNNLLRKTQSRNMAGLVLYAVKNGIVSI
ncbi:MAG: response regulator transcription factor [Marinoscillum sp.]